MIGKFGRATFVLFYGFYPWEILWVFFVEGNLKRGGHDKFKREFLSKVVKALQNNG